MAGSRILITGGGSGIGRLMALEAARRGADVVLWDLDLPAADAVAAEVRELGREAVAQVVDVTDAAAVERAAGELPDDVDVVINNAGIVTGRTLIQASESEIRRTFEVNTLAPYWVTKQFLPGMMARDSGAIVTIASAAGLVGVARQTDYSASKFAAFGFMESLRNELRHLGSRVGALTVAPYYIDTGMFEGVRTKVPLLLPILDAEKVASRVIDAIEKGRVQLIMPPFAKAVQAIRFLPAPVFDWTVELFGIQDSMDEFKGRG